MHVTVRIPGQLRTYTSGQAEIGIDVHVVVAAATVRDALMELSVMHPGVRDRVMDEQGRVRQHVNVFVGRESIRFMGGLDTPIADGAVLSIYPSVSGG